jgi:predicted lipid-binding transport protein (Tim44 family)
VETKAWIWNNQQARDLERQHMNSKHWMVGVLTAALFGAGMPEPAEAKRFGGGRSLATQRNMPERMTPPPPAKPGQPATAPTTPAQQAAPGTAAGAAAAPAAAARRSWMGPLAGLAAGLGIAALMSHLGLSEAFGNFLMLALLLVGGLFLVRFLMRRFSGATAGGGMNTPQPAFASGAGATATRTTRQAPQQFVDERPNPPARPDAHAPSPLLRTQLPQETPFAASNAGFTAPGQVPTDVQPPAIAPAFVPASFDSEGFARVAKAIFIRMQTANDAGDLDDLRRFTTPEMFAEVRLDLQERGDVAQQTDVLNVDAEVLDVAHEDGRQIVSVRYRGQVREEAGGEATSFDEIWHLSKPDDDSRNWAIAGIEQGR